MSSKKCEFLWLQILCVMYYFETCLTRIPVFLFSSSFLFAGHYHEKVLYFITLFLSHPQSECRAGPLTTPAHNSFWRTQKPDRGGNFWRVITPTVFYFGDFWKITWKEDRFVVAEPTCGFKRHRSCRSPFERFFTYSFCGFTWKTRFFVSSSWCWTYLSFFAPPYSSLAGIECCVSRINHGVNCGIVFWFE